MAVVKITYFKPSGKYYTSGEYETSAEVKDGMVSMYIVSDEIKRMRSEKKLPGIVNGSGFFIVADCAEGYPIMLHPLEQ